MIPFVQHKKLSEYKAVVLDMDGTLYYQFPVRICMAVSLFCFYLLHLNRISELREIYTYRVNYKFRKMQDSTPNIVYWMQEKPKKYIRLFRDKNLIKIVQSLQRKGTKVIVYSDFPLKEKLEALWPFVPDLYFSANDAEIQCLKPDVKGLLHIIRITNLSVKDILFVGDRFDKDGLCAQQTGMDYFILSQNSMIRKRFYKGIER